MLLLLFLFNKFFTFDILMCGTIFRKMIKEFSSSNLVQKEGYLDEREVCPVYDG